MFVLLITKQIEAMKKGFFVLLFFVCLNISNAQDFKSYSFTNFDAISISGYFDVILEQSTEYKFEIKADDVLKNILKVSKNGNEIVVYLKKIDNVSLDGHKGIIKVSAPVFRSIEFEGLIHSECENTLKSEKMEVGISGLARVEMDLHVKNIEINIEGGSHLLLKGVAKDVDIDVEGAAVFAGLDLTTKNATVNISGIGKADVNVSDRLEVNIEGLGIVNYANSPELIENSSFLGIVRQL